MKKDSQIVDILVDKDVSWKFNIPRSPWWGGFFERMVGLTKGVLFKALGGAKLSFASLKEVLLDVEVILNNRPLGYIENDIQLPILTPNMLIHRSEVKLPKESLEDDPDVNEMVPSKLAKRLKASKDMIWRRWKDEYVRALRERHNLGPGEVPKISAGDIVFIHNENKNRGTWKLGLVVKIIEKDGVPLGAKLKTKVDNIIERSVKHLYPLELHTDINDDEKKNNSENSNEINVRPTRIAKTKAIRKITATSNFENESDEF